MLMRLSGWTAVLLPALGKRATIVARVVSG
jgi:hypothetical protein